MKKPPNMRLEDGIIRCPRWLYCGQMENEEKLNFDFVIKSDDKDVVEGDMELSLERMW